MPSSDTIFTISVCADCAHLHANGEVPERFSEAEVAAWFEEIDRQLEGCHVLGIGEDLGFSRDSCDGCKSRLGGDRFELFTILV